MKPNDHEKFTLMKPFQNSPQMNWINAPKVGFYAHAMINGRIIILSGRRSHNKGSYIFTGKRLGEHQSLIIFSHFEYFKVCPSRNFEMLCVNDSKGYKVEKKF